VRFLIALIAVLPLAAQTAERPLTALPYTPSLETSFMDRTVDPCVDFFKYSCGNWLKINPIPADQSRWDVYGKMADDNQRFLWGILEEYAKPSPSRTPNQQKIGDFFGACMDEPAIEKAGAAPLKPMLDAITAMKTMKDLPPLLARFHLEAGGSELFGFGSNQDFEDSNQIIAFANAGGLGLPDRDYYTKTDAKSVEIRARYVQHVARMLGLIGDPTATARTEAQTVMSIETALAKASLTATDKRDPYKLYHKETRAQFESETPSFGWSAYWSAAGLATPAKINNSEPAFMKEVERQLKTRSLADWKTYLRWHLVNDKAAYLSHAFVQADFDFYRKYLRGVAALPPRWKRCVRLVDRDLGEALGQVFVEKTFTDDTRRRALAMTKEIENAMEKDLHQIAWMGDATRQQALTKLHTIVNKIGYPEKWRDYSSVRIEPGDFLGNVERATTF